VTACRRKPVSALAPSARLLCLALLAGLVFSSRVWTLGCLLALLLALLLKEGLDLPALLRELPGLAYLMALTLLLESLRFGGGIHLDPEGLARAGLWALRLLEAFLLGRLFYKTTSGSELREAASDLGRLVPRRLGRGPGEDLALALFLILGFIPSIVSEWRLSEEAGRARGLSRGSGPRLRLRVLEAFLRRLVLRALVLPEALASRGWMGAIEGRRRPWPPSSRFAVLVSCLLLGLGLIHRL